MMYFIVNNVESTEKHNLQKVFTAIDRNNDGLLSRSELLESLVSSGKSEADRKSVV